MPPNDRERNALTQMRRTEPKLDGWRLRAHQVEEPERGSELAIDDEIFPRHAISQFARGSLIHSGEHLRLALDALHRGQLYPSAHFTVLRGALVGAAQAVWILSPEARSDRCERGLTAFTEMHDQQGKYNRFFETVALDANDRSNLNAHGLWIHERQAQVQAARVGRADLNLTDVIAAAADHVFNSTDQRSAVRRLWREMSSDAHVLGWAVYQRSEFGPPDRRTGIGEGRAGGSPLHVAEAFMASYRILKAGWSLFDRRCEERLPRTGKSSKR